MKQRATVQLYLVPVSLEPLHKFHIVERAPLHQAGHFHVLQSFDNVSDT